MKLNTLWKQKSEEDIQGCIEEAFTNLGYNVINIHKSDKYHENGIDIECINPDGKTNIQVKIKPGMNDIAQLKLLSSSDSDGKIYVYVEPPAESFRKEMAKHENIKFFDIEKLHELLLKGQSTTYIRYIILDTDLLKSLTKILENIISNNSVDPINLENKHLNQWWLFKDRAVKFHASIELIRDQFQFLKEKDDIEVNEIQNNLEKVINLFDLVYKDPIKDLNDIVSILKRTYPNILSKYCKVAFQRSNWIGIPENSENERFIFLLRNWLISNEIEQISFFNQINFYLHHLKDVAEAIEDGVDWLFEDMLKN